MTSSIDNGASKVIYLIDNAASSSQYACVYLSREIQIDKGLFSVQIISLENLLRLYYFITLNH